LKRFAHVQAELYHFPTDEDLALEDEPAVVVEDPAPQDEAQTTPAEPLPEQSEEDAPDNPVDFAKVQADAIIANARRQAEEILAKARVDAEEETKKACEQARESGHQAGYLDGVAQAQVEAAQYREEQAAAMAEEVHKFLDKATERIEKQMDDQVDELRDLALSVAEKVVCISLKSSSEVIARMIQTAIDKKKHKEWVRIYVSECDAKKMTQIPQSLTSALASLSDRVRIIPVADDEPGTCIIEMPDEIIDASASTQLNNLRGMLLDVPGGGSSALMS
jgi:flagellar assembly protein FliH